MVYVSYDEYTNRYYNPELTEDEYGRIAPIADLIIDDWTLDRVGRAVRNGETLPDSVVTVYLSICEAAPSILESSKLGNDPVSSFSNGVDSFTFETSASVIDQVTNSIGWLADLLPIEWISACVSFEGGNKYAR